MGKKFMLKLAITMCLVLLACVANAETGVSIASGYGVADIVPLRIAGQKSWQQEWYKDYTWSIRGFWELSAYHLSGKKGALPKSNRNLNALALAPVFRLNRQTAFACNTYPYLEFAIGIAQLSKREIGGRWQGIKFAFEDRLGIGIRFGNDKQYDINYRAVHFSNAYLGNYNHGINLHMLSFGLWF